MHFLIRVENQSIFNFAHLRRVRATCSSVVQNGRSWLCPWLHRTDLLWLRGTSFSIPPL